MYKSMKGISAVAKVRIVEQYLKGETSLGRAGKKISVARTTIEQWIQIYNTGGPTALRPQKRNRNYPKELKLKAINEYLNGEESLRSICEKYHIRNHIQLKQWLKVYKYSWNVKIRKRRELHE